MTKRIGGSTAQGGFYWNLGKWEMQTVPKHGGMLTGDTADRYIKVPLLGLLVLAPMMGALYVIFLPFLGFVLVLNYAARKAGRLLQAGFMGAATTIAPHWQPGEAYLARRRRAREEQEEKRRVKKTERI